MMNKKTLKQKERKKKKRKKERFEKSIIKMKKNKTLKQIDNNF